MPATVPAVHPAASRLRQALVGLGWLGLVLFAADELMHDWQFETANHTLLRVFDVVKNCLFALWPLSIWLPLEPRLTGPARDLLNLGLCMLIFPWWRYCGLLAMTEDQAPWQDELVMHASGTPPLRIVQQYQDVSATTNIRYRVVQITPLWGPWQHVEPADPARFPLEPYR